jgi:hypothetical protein
MLNGVIRRTFRFDKGDYWDGDEEIIHFLEEQLLEIKGI